MADMATSVLARLKNKAAESGRSYQLCLQLFCQEEFLRRLEKSKYANNLVLKGGLFIYSITNFDSRVTVDVDFLLRKISNTPEHLKLVLEEIISCDTGNDFITFEVKSVAPIAIAKKYADIRYTTHYRVSPEWKEADFDGDGVNELAMITFVKHGTGLGVDSLYIVDQDEAGEWEMYEFLHADYCRQLRKHFNTVIDGDDTWFVFDGQWIGAPELFNNEVSSYRYDVENQIEFEFTSDGIKITAEIEGISTSSGWSDYPGYYISAQVKHLDDGNWQLSNVRCRTSE